MDPYVQARNVEPIEKYNKKEKLQNKENADKIDKNNSVFDEEYESTLLESPPKDQNAKHKRHNSGGNQYENEYENGYVMSGQTRKNKMSAIAFRRFDGRPKTSQSIAARVGTSNSMNKGRHLISQCVPSRQQLQQFAQRKQTEQIVSALPTNRDSIENNIQYTELTYEKMMQSLYKIKSNSFLQQLLVPQQILKILLKFVNNANDEAILEKQLGEKQLSPRFKSLIEDQSKSRVNAIDQNRSSINKNSYSQFESHQNLSTNLEQNKNPNLTARYEEMLFNIKLTDLTDLENPFVIYENKKIDQQGYLIFDNFDLSILNPTKIFPWLMNSKDLERRTLKIEVTFQQELVLLRFIHLDRFFEIQFPQIMLEISNNMTQNQTLLQKQILQKNKAEQNKQQSSQNQEEEGVLVIKQITAQSIHIPMPSILQNEKVKQSLDSADPPIETLNADIEVEGNILPGFETVFYYALKPVKNAVYNMLNELKTYKLNLRDVKTELYNKQIDLKPALMKHLRIIIEFTDCIVQAQDLVNFSIIQQDNQLTNQQVQRIKSGHQNIKSSANSADQQSKVRLNSISGALNPRPATGDISQIQGTQITQNPLQKYKTILIPNQVRSKSIFQKYGQNREVQFLMRKELDKQIKQNRTHIYKPISAVKMSNNKSVFQHLNNTALQSMPMPIEYNQRSTPLFHHKQKSTIFPSRQYKNTKVDSNTTMHRESEDNGTTSQRFKQFESYRSFTKNGFIQKGMQNIDEDEFQPTLNQVYPNYVKSLAAYADVEDPHSYLNLPYTRVQDSGGAMATPSYFYRGANFKKSVSEMHWGSNFTKPQSISQSGIRLQQQSTSLTYFDKNSQIYGLQGMSPFNERQK